MSDAATFSTSTQALSGKSYDYDHITEQGAAFRILKLHPSSHPDSELYCTLETVDLRDQPQYKALSYTWRGSPSRRTISLKGCQFPVTDNLFSILKWLRHPIEFQRFWIDAICINQDDDQERSHQVSIMRQIYTSAAQLLIWLGDSEEGIESALKTIGQHELDPPSMDLTSTMECVERVLASPWWTRMWTLQEMAVARRHPLMICGKTTLSLDTFYTVSLTIEGILRERSGKRVLSDSDALLALRNAGIRAAWRSYFSGTMIRYNNDSRLDSENRLWLADLLVATSVREATDPKDHVFALVGLVPTLPKSLRPNYRESTECVFQRAMLEILKFESTRDLLRFAKYSERPDLPSWCIDFSAHNWNAPPTNLPRLARLGHRDALVQAGWPSDIQHDLSSGSITLSGRIYGDIVSIVGPLTKQGFAASTITALRNGCDFESPLLTLMKLVLAARRPLKPLVERTICTIVEIIDLASGASELSTRISLELKDLWRRQLKIELDRDSDSDPSRRNRWRKLRQRLRSQNRGQAIREWLEEEFARERPGRKSRKSDGTTGRRTNKLKRKASEDMQDYKYDPMIQWLAGPEDYAGDLEIDDSLVHQLDPIMNLLLQEIEAQSVLDTEEFSIFATTTGTLGRVIGHVSNGDGICAFAGCHNPAVLRQTEEGRYRIIDFALVPGVSTHTDAVWILNGLKQPSNQDVTLC